MTDLLSVIEFASNATYVVLALVAVRFWVRDRSAGAAYVAGAFVSTGLVVVLAQFLPENDPPLQALRLVILGIIALPWLLHRFVVSMDGIRRSLSIVLDAMTAALVVATYLVGEFPGPDEEPAGVFAVYVLVFMVHWATLTTRTSWRLWRASSRQPGVIRSRLRVLSAASAGLGLAIVVPNMIDNEFGAVLGAVFGAVSGALFLLGFSPPRLFRTNWREGEERDLHAATKLLMQAATHDDVARTVLPSMVALTGADAGAIVGPQGQVRAVAGDGADLVDAPTAEDAVIELVLARGDRLLLRTSPYSPLFGQDEREMLDRLVSLVDLAVDRAVLLASERDARRDSERANREVEAFVATITHDLRNPLTAIVGMSDLLVGPLQEELSERALKFVTRISANAEYMTGMVRDILDLAEINSSTSKPEPVDLTVVAGVVREELIMRAPTADVVVGALPTLMGDPTHLRRLFENVVNNAVKHAGRPDVRVTITATQREDMLELSFLDNGVGIPREAADRVFGLFEQLEGSEGSGLGLAICRKLAESMKGSVWFEPSDVGADLRVRVPASLILGATTDRSASETTRSRATESMDS